MSAVLPFFVNKKRRNIFCASFLCWGTRARTRNDRTRICSVTITPYPMVLNSDAKVMFFFILQIKNHTFFIKSHKIQSCKSVNIKLSLSLQKYM